MKKVYKDIFAQFWNMYLDLLMLNHKINPYIYTLKSGQIIPKDLKDFSLVEKIRYCFMLDQTCCENHVDAILLFDYVDLDNTTDLPEILKYPTGEFGIIGEMFTLDKQYIGRYIEYIKEDDKIIQMTKDLEIKDKGIYNKLFPKYTEGVTYV